MISMYHSSDHRAFSFVVFTAVFFLQSSRHVAAAGPSFALNPVDFFCGRWYQQSAIKNDMLFIDSGVEKWNVTGVTDPFYGINNYIITIPLNFSWDWKTDIIINADPKNKSNPATGTLPPSLTRGRMFQGPANDPAVYIYGGTTYMGNMSFQGYSQPDANTYPLWSYTQNTSSYQWGQYDLGTTWSPNHGASAEAVDQGLGFYLNGQIDWGTSTLAQNISNTTAYEPLDGMIVLDLVNQTATNISTPGIGGGGPRVGGTMEYFPSVGGMGILVALGGMVNNTGSPLILADSNHGNLIDFQTIDVFDIDSYTQSPQSNGTWYRQNTTGAIPEPRIDFCTVSISAQDNSSHHIYMYGGIDPRKGQDKAAGYDDVYVLSLPSFTWTAIYTNGQSPRWGHDCHVAGTRQMITIGGNITNTGICDWELKGVAFLEMSTITWGSVFLTNTTFYQVPKVVLPATGGNANGSATITAPTAGWNDQGLKTVFSTPRKYPVSPSSSTPATAPPKKKNHAGAIAGGVVGGIVGLALILGALFFLRRRRAKARLPRELDSAEVARRETELGTEKKEKHELQAVNPGDPAELPGTPPHELNAPRELVEADRTTATDRAELSATNVVKGGTTGVPIVRTPGDDLPTSPFATPLSAPVSSPLQEPISPTPEVQSHEPKDDTLTESEKART